MKMNIAIHDDMYAIKIMIYPFIEQMKQEIKEAEGKGAKQMVADVALSVFHYLKEHDLLTRRDVELLESYDIPLLEMYARGDTVYPVQ